MSSAIFVYTADIGVHMANSDAAALVVAVDCVLVAVLFAVVAAVVAALVAGLVAGLVAVLVAGTAALVAVGTDSSYIHQLRWDSQACCRDIDIQDNFENCTLPKHYSCSADNFGMPGHSKLGHIAVDSHFHIHNFDFRCLRGAVVGSQEVVDFQKVEEVVGPGGSQPWFSTLDGPP